MRVMTGKRVLITGASRGLGLALAKEFGSRGADLLLTARSGEQLEDIQGHLAGEFSIECRTVAGDLTEKETLDALLEQCSRTPPHVLINNAGLLSMDELNDVSADRIHALVELNLLAPIFLTQALLPGFKSRNSGIIININSIAGLKPAARHTVYTATKFGLRGFAEALKEELTGTGIEILNVYPGKMMTNLFADDGKNLDDATFMPPEEIARVVADLLAMDPRCRPTELVVERAR